MYIPTAWQCNGYSKVTGKQTKVVTLDCYIKDGNNWYVWSEYKYRLATKGVIE